MDPSSVPHPEATLATRKRKPQAFIQASVATVEASHGHPHLPITPTPPLQPSRHAGANGSLAYKIATDWVRSISRFVALHHQHKKQAVERAMMQKTFKDMTSALAEVEDQKSLISFDIITESGLHTVVNRLADARIVAAKSRPSERAAELLACWRGRFPGRLPEGQMTDEMDVDS
ncbi:hypothetical protein C8Q80DRAFT_1268708 [Daedaleopsis nitida]|nr:hypothetical protein C8Q80DRAFT_1268708 [Daedaleopsis nitida]